MTADDGAALEAHFSEQLDFMASSASRYDYGAEHEAKRIAATLRTLFHQTGNSHALFPRLPISEGTRFLDSAGEFDPENKLTTANLVAMVFRPEGPTFVPRFQGEGGGFDWVVAPNLKPTALVGARQLRPAGEQVAFDEWWTMTVIKDGGGNIFSRRELVLKVANTDGGAHIDPKLPRNYADLTRGNSLGFFVSQSGRNVGALRGNPALASLRQIAYEVLQTLQ